MKKIFTLAVVFFVFALFAGGETRARICFTFDDRFFDSWEQAMPIFEKYDATATFFVDGRIDHRALTAMKKLQSAGHSIGLHSFGHARVTDYVKNPQKGMDAYIAEQIKPQLDVCRANGIKIRAFAYPQSACNSYTDKKLFEVFDFVRTGHWGVVKKGRPMTEWDGLYVKNVAAKQRFNAFGVCGDFDMQQTKDVIRRAAENGETVVFYSHNIIPPRKNTHDISTVALEELLQFAKSLNVKVCGLNEL